MQKKIILVVILLFSFLFFNCDNMKKQQEMNEQSMNIDPNLIQKYSNELNNLSIKNSKTDHLSMNTYFGSKVFGEIFIKEFNEFKNHDYFFTSRCFKFDESIYIIISNGNCINSSSIFIKIAKKQHDVILIFNSDCSVHSFKPQKVKLNVSSENINIGDSIVGELFCSYKDSSFGYICDGFFLGIVEDCNIENAKYLLYFPSGKKIID